MDRIALEGLVLESDVFVNDLNQVFEHGRKRRRKNSKKAMLE